ncbi:hypothetical protein BDZ91DRAFT_444693 [Kalaharituber pfeilii]|nr:hypothetical protein BDZ91DRAFT_444693 [Kalaharituber pfeilii]
MAVSILSAGCRLASRHETWVQTRPTNKRYILVMPIFLVYHLHLQVSDMRVILFLVWAWLFSSKNDMRVTKGQGSVT